MNPAPAPRSRRSSTAAARTAENFTETGSRVCRSFYPAADPHFWRYNGIALNDGHEPLARLGVVVREEQTFAMSSAVSVKSNRSKFCCIRSLWTDFGITTTPRCMRKRSAVCAAVLPYFVTIREGTRLSAKSDKSDEKTAHSRRFPLYFQKNDDKIKMYKSFQQKPTVSGSRGKRNEQDKDNSTKRVSVHRNVPVLSFYTAACGRRRAG